MIGEAVATAARLREANVPPLDLIAGDAEKLRGELDTLIERAGDLVREFDALDLEHEHAYLDARAWFLSTRLNDVRRAITLAHCELIPRENVKRREAALRTAEYLRQQMPIEHRVVKAA